MVQAVLPDGPRTPRLVQALGFVLARNRTMNRLRDRYGSAFTLDTLGLGRMVLPADPAAHPAATRGHTGLDPCGRAGAAARPARLRTGRAIRTLPGLGGLNTVT